MEKIKTAKITAVLPAAENGSLTSKQGPGYMSYMPVASRILRHAGGRARMPVLRWTESAFIKPRGLHSAF